MSSIKKPYSSLLELIGTTDSNRGHRTRLTIAFDVDSTLIDHEERPIYKNVMLLKRFVEDGMDVVIWSGGGVSYAERFSRKLGFEGLVRVVEKGSELVDLAFDDQLVNLGKVNYEV